jgi:ketosteroid isomerase-like protein
MGPIAHVAARHYQRGLRAVERGDLDALLSQFSPQCTLRFIGDTPLGAELSGLADIRRWFERFARLLPAPRFEIRRLMIVGPPWQQRLAAHVAISSTVDGEPYRNEFAHFLAIRWGRVIDDLVLEDTQKWERACRRLVDGGVAEASAPGLTPSPR